MQHIHPFPARMAPEIAIKKLENLPEDYQVLDPMAGSGMVISAASKFGLNAIGYDIDPLACLLSKTSGTRLDEKRVLDACDLLIERSQNIDPPKLHWIDEKTEKYIDFWFAPKQKHQLARLSHLLLVDPISKNKTTINLLKVALSRLIISKNPRASRARDTAHSRPHRTIIENEFDVFDALPKSVHHVLKALNADRIKNNATIYKGDARNMWRTKCATVDCIITSPPYLNAIDYMRGHKLSLVWLGYDLTKLQKIRSSAVGSEKAGDAQIHTVANKFLETLPTDFSQKHRAIIRRYAADLFLLTSEACRVLKPGRTATYVIGNSKLCGHNIPNSDLLINAAQTNGLQLVEQTMRNIPENKRYLPLLNSANSTLSNRMRTEHVLMFRKTS